MERVLRERDALRPGRLDLILTITLGVLGLVTILVAVDPSVDLVVVDRTLDAAVDSLTTLAAFGLAALALARYRESSRLSSLFQASALFLLAVVGGTFVLLVVLRLDGRVGLSLGSPDQAPVYIVVITWLIAAVLFTIAAGAAVRGLRARPALARRLILGPPLVVGIAALVIYPIADYLPPLIGPDGIAAIIQDPWRASPLPGVEPILLALISMIAALLIIAALLLRFAYVQGGPVTDGFLSVALLVAAFAQIHYAMYPGVYTGLVTTSDALRLAFYGVLLLGIDAEARSDLRALRAAYAALDRLRVTENERAALEERTRLAREIHDGLAQHLWFAKLKHERLAPLVPDEARGLSGEVGQALDAAIVEARQALVTMRSGTDPQMPLDDLILRMADDFGNRSGLRVDTALAELPASLPARQQAEVLRVVQEALTNVGKHADATMVRIRATMDDDDLLVTISDNGRGFDPETVRDDGLGLQGMEERARLMGGLLTVSSEHSDGTTVTLRLPLGPAGSTTGQEPSALAAIPPAATADPTQPPAVIGPASSATQAPRP